MQRFSITGLLLTIALAVLMALGGAVDGLAAEEKSPQEKQQKAAAKKAPREKPAGRLPNYFAEVVDKAQREAIYKIQQEYEPKLAELRRQLEELTKQRDEKIRAVLTPEQLKKVEQLQEQAKKKREAAKAKPSPDQPGKPPKPEPETPADKPPQQ